MTEQESRLSCALAPTREAAEALARRLGELGIPATVARPEQRRHGLAPGVWEVTVPASQAARARAALSAEGR